MIELTNQEIRTICGTRMPLKGIAERHAKTVLTCLTIEMRVSRDLLRDNRIWVADWAVSQGEDVLVYRNAIHGKTDVFPIMRKELREEVERQSELLVDKWLQIYNEQIKG